MGRSLPFSSVEFQERSIDMPNHKSAEKRDRQNAVRNAANTANRSRLRTSLKKLRAAITSGDVKEAQTLLPDAVSVLDKSVQKGVIHRNTAARHKARLTKHVNELVAK
jgi:small subunit ribosomal protein S20